MAAPADASALVQAILDRVYSPFTGPGWRPRPFPSRCRRYLWSDAFGVCSYLTLFYVHNRESKYLDQASMLINDVIEDLGCLRNTKTRLPGASDEHPTRGGLRIGKEDQNDDGQYYHYLTKWMFALNRMSVAHQDPKFNEWAVDLAHVAHQNFVVRGIGGRALRMVWKKSIDLQQVMVSSEGNLDPMDGLVVYKLLQSTSADKAVLQREISEMQQLVDRKLPAFVTHDALDSGEALWLSQWFPSQTWSQELEDTALTSIDRLFRSGRFREPASYRLMFREMGTILGLKTALHRMTDEGERRNWMDRIDQVMRFWGERVYERDSEISPLMFAAALLPGVWDPSFDSPTAP